MKKGFPIYFVFGLIVAAISWSSFGESVLYSRDDGDHWIAGNETLEIAVSKKRGTLTKLLDKISQVDYCTQTVTGAVPAREFMVGSQIVGLTLYDELEKVVFSDILHSPEVSEGEMQNGDGNVTITLRKKFPGADFVVDETFSINTDHLRWNVRVRKTRGPDRTLRVIQLAPLPLGSYQGWAPISDAPFAIKPYTPFAVDYGQSVSGSVGEVRWRTLIPTIVFYSEETGRALSFTHPFEVPAVRIRFLNNTGALADFHWNSRSYPPVERPYLQVSNEYLGLRDEKDVETSLLIASHPGNWRPALGWIYEQYREYFDPDPNFDKWDGVFVSGYDLMKDSYTDQDRRNILEGRKKRGALWEEQHGHFPWYGLMIPGPEVEKWICESHEREGYTNSREKIAAHAQLNNEFGIGTFIYYNLTEAEHWYGQKSFPDSIARDEAGNPIGAYRAARYPDKRACWLMNADPDSSFGKHMIEQAREMVDAYPAIGGFFWDVYGRSYMFDFAHDDGITLVNNRPAYYSGFMFERMMQNHIGPLLRRRGMCVTANKPTTIVHCKGLDGIMARERNPDTELPPWIVAQSYTGLNRHVMILDGHSGGHTEKLLLNCLRYGMFYSDIGKTGEDRQPLTERQIAVNERIVQAYFPFIQRFRGKTWIFHPRALELPRHADGNIFRLKNGSVMVTIVSYWKAYREVEGFENNLEVICRLPDASDLQHVYISSMDLEQTWKVKARQEDESLTVTVPRHGKGTVIILSAEPDSQLESML
jgi:hypothetical protein